MKHLSAFQRICLVAGIAASMCAVEAHAQVAAPSPRKTTVSEELAKVDYLVGSWNCLHTVGAFRGTYTTTYAKVLGGSWLEQRYDFPQQKTADRDQPASTAVALMGFDERRQTWVRFFANSEGQHFPIRMSDTDSGWSWKYSSFYVRTTPDTPDPDAMFIRKSNTEYEINGPTYPQGSTRVTEHHVCQKS